MTKVEEYSLKSKTGKHIRYATRVTFPNGRKVDFLEVMTRKAAIAQAQDVLYHDYREYFLRGVAAGGDHEGQSDQEPMSREHYQEILEYAEDSWSDEEDNRRASTLPSPTRWTSCGG